MTDKETRTSLGRLFHGGILSGFWMLLMTATLMGQSASMLVMPYYQSWSRERDGSFSQFTGLASITLPVSTALTLTASARPMSSGGDFSTIGGMSDTELSIKYLFSDPGVVLTIGASLPTGLVELSREEFLTSVLFSHSVFGMQVPQFGQGLNLNPGLLYAFSIRENVAAGIGITYHYKARFKPVQSVGDYDPGDEVLATAGLELQLDEGETLSMDAIFTFYGTDILEDEEVFHSGNKIVGGLAYSRFFGFHRLTAAARYRIRGKSDISVAGKLINAQQKMEPDNFEFSVGYAARLTADLSASLTMEARLYQETPIPISGIALFSPGVSSEWRITKALSMPVLFKYHAGTLKEGQMVTGMEGGAGLRFNF